MFKIGECSKRSMLKKDIRDSAELLHEAIPGSCMEILPGLRHGDFSINHPKAYARMLTEWIRRKPHDTE